MKKIIKIFLLLTISLSIYSTTKAIDCLPAWDGTWVVTQSCNWPQSYANGTSKDDFMITGNIEVGNYTITLNGGDNIGLDLSSRWIKFGNGKINLSTSSRIQNNAANTRFYLKFRHGHGTDNPTGGHPCPTGMKAFYHDDRNPVAFVRISATDSSNSHYNNSGKIRQEINNGASRDGWLYCGTMGQRWENTGTSGYYNNGYPGSY